jgi:16S rRNA G966 N2-methylase RsmD
LNLNLNVFKSDVNNYVSKTNNTYDIIFADPPYNFTLNELSVIIKNIFERPLLNDFGVLIVEHSKFVKLNDLDNFNKMKKYGHCCFSFFE